MMRRTFSLLLALMVSMAICGCISSDGTSDAGPTTPAPTTAAPSTEPPSETAAPTSVPTSTAPPTCPSGTPAVHEPLQRPTTTLPPETLPPQQDVYAENDTAYRDGSGYTVVVGEVVNNSSGNVTSVRVCAVFYDACGRVITSSYAYAMIDVLAPGQRAPFQVSTYPVIAASAEYSLCVSHLTTTARPYTGLKIIRQREFVDACGYHTIVGEVGNLGCCTMLYVKVVATYYDRCGNVIGAAFAYTTPKEIERCESSAFELSSFPQQIAPYRYELQVQGHYQIPGPS